jgi:hypothetical protein
MNEEDRALADIYEQITRGEASAINKIQKIHGPYKMK